MVQYGQTNVRFVFSTPNLPYKPKIRIKITCFDIKTRVGTLKIPLVYSQDTQVRWYGQSDVRFVFSTPNLPYKPKITIKLSCSDIKTHVGTLKIPRFYPQDTHAKWDGETNVRSVFSTFSSLYKPEITIKISCFDIKTHMGRYLKNTAFLPISHQIIKI